MSRDCKKILLITLAALVLTLPTVGVRDITTSHEGRVAQTARLMAASGWPWNAQAVSVADVGWQTDPDGAKRLRPDSSLPQLTVNPWIVPVINDEIRLQKPPLPYWVTAVCFKLLGANEFAARVVPAILWALLTLIVADLASMLIHPRAAVWAAGVWVSSYFGFDEFRKCMADPYLAFFAIAAVWAGVRGNDEVGTMNDERKTNFIVHRSSFIVLFYIFLSLGFLSKGPAVFVPVIGGLIAAWSIKRTAFRRPSISAHAVGLLLFLLIALPWYAIVWHRVPNALLLWKYESLGGFGEKNEKPEPIWFYLPQLLLIVLPWTPVWIAGVVASLKRRRRAAALVWQGIIVLVFSLITQKKNAYLLPATAAQTLVVVQGLFYWFAWARRSGRSVQLRKRVPYAIVFLSGLIAIGFPIYSCAVDNARSFSSVGRELSTGIRSGSFTTHYPIYAPSLPPDAAFYLPLEPQQASALTKYVVVDDRRNTASDSPRAFASLFPGRDVIAARRVPLQSSPPDFRWKVFEVTLAR